MIAIVILIAIFVIYNTIGLINIEFFITDYVQSSVDGEIYPVISSFKDKAEAANVIANINLFATNLITALQDAYVDNELILPASDKKVQEYLKGREITNILLNRFRKRSLRENSPTDITQTSYTTNKGEIISLCLRKTENNSPEFHDINIIKFVFLHELSHIVTPELQHTKQFWINFRFLLEFCENRHIYDIIDYHKHNVNYCGLLVTYVPTNDDSLVSYFK